MEGRLRNNTGFSLIELLLSLAILSIIIIAMTSLLVSAARFNKLSEKQYKATLLAKNYMELIKAAEEFSLGQTSYFADNARIIVNVNEISRYQGEVYRINVEVIIDGETIEELYGYKILFH